MNFIDAVRVEGFVEPNPTLRPCDICFCVSEGEPYEVELGYAGRPEISWWVRAHGAAFPSNWYFPPTDGGHVCCIDEQGEYCESGFKLHCGETYHLSIKLAAKPGYAFADKVKLYVNGEEVSFALEPVEKTPFCTYFFGGFSWYRSKADNAYFEIDWTTPHACISHGY